MTKIVCPTCGIHGHLQTRGNSLRIQHYLEYVDEKRKYEYHRITREYLESVEVNGSKTVEVNDFNPSPISEMDSKCFSQKFDAYKNFFGHTDSHDSPHDPFFSVNINETFVNA